MLKFYIMLYGRGLLVRIPIGYNLARFRKDKKRALQFSKAMSKMHSAFVSARKYSDLIRKYFSTNL